MLGMQIGNTLTTALRTADDRRSGTAVIVGASLAGLMTALTLSRSGISVTLLERSDDSGRTGAALHVADGLIERITGNAIKLHKPLASGIQTWFTVHAGLRAAVQADPYIQLHQCTTVLAIDQNDESAWAIASDNRRYTGDVVIGADGHGSVVRRSVSPDKPDASFAGYVIWLGIAQETAIEAHGRWPSDTAFLGDGDDYFLGYPLPGNNGSVRSGSRQLGWAWYDKTRNDLLRQTGSVVGNIVRHSIRASDIPEATFAELEREANERWPTPWRNAVLDCIRRRAVIGTPIAEYVPDRLVNGRLALVGDAAHVPTPMTGNGFSASLQDAESLAQSLISTRGPEVPRALLDYQNARLSRARSLVQGGQQFSRSFANQL